MFTTQQYATQTLVLGSRPWPRGLFTLSARLVDGAGAGRCRMPGAVSDQVLAGRRAGRGWGPRSTAGAGFGILADLARGVRCAPNFQPTELIYLRGVEGQNPALSSHWLQHTNEPRFRRRVKAILEPYKRWFGNSSTRDALVNTICDTRNYLTHYDEVTTGDRAKGPQELHELYKQLEALFQLHLLGILGIDGPAIDSIVRNNRSLRGWTCPTAHWTTKASLSARTCTGCSTTARFAARSWSTRRGAGV